MNEHRPADRLRHLLEQLANETISAKQHSELQRLLIDHPEAQDAYFEFMDLHVGLQILTSAQSSAGGSVQAEPAAVGSENRRVRMNANGARTRRPDEPGRRHHAQAGRRHIAVGATTVAAGLLLIALLALFQRPGDSVSRDSSTAFPFPDSQPAERPEKIDGEADSVILVQAAGARLFGEFLPPAGGSMKFGHEYALISGTVELRFPDGAEVILEAPGVMTITGRDRLLLNAGTCSVHAPPGAEGFQIETPQTEITDLGTRFSVSVSEVGETDVQVLEGLAEVRPTGHESTRSIRLAARQARRFSGDVTTDPQVLDFRPGRFRRTLPDRVVRYDVRTTDDGLAAELKSVTVQRGGRMQTIPVRDLTGIKVSFFRAGKSHANVAVPPGCSGDRLAVL